MTENIVENDVGPQEQSIACLTEEPEVPSSNTGPAHTFVDIDHDFFVYDHFPPLGNSRRAVVSNWRKYRHIVHSCLGGPNISRNNVARLTDRPA